MINSFKNYCSGTALFVACISTPVFAQNKNVNCPNLTAGDVISIIDSGTIATEQGYTLADEAKLSRAQVIINEPTANPFDTFYQMMGSKTIDNQQYFIYVGSVLGNTPYEAKNRAKKILLGDEKTFSAKYDPENFTCKYKEMTGSPATPDYPFKSTYETVVLNAVPIDVTAAFMHRMMMKRSHV